MQTEQPRRADTVAYEWSTLEAVDLKARFQRLWDGRLWILGGTVAAAVMMTVVVFVMTPVYRATVLLAPSSDDRSGLSRVIGSALGGLGSFASLAGLSNTRDDETQQALAVLRSRKFTEAFIKDNNLMPRLFARRWDEQAKRWKGDPSWPTPGRAYKYFNRKVRSIVEDKKTGLISMNIDWHDRAEAAAWANQLIQRLNAEMRERSIAKAAASLGYLQKELAGTDDVGTRDAINRLIEVQIKQRMLANVTEEYAFRVIDPALPAEPYDVLKPKKALLIVIGALLGGALAAVAVLLFRRRPEAQ